MQENEFEKQVQQKMDELKLQPSDAVWQKIKVEIKEEKRRRWILFILPLMLIGVLYGGYKLLNEGRDTPAQITENIKKDNTRQKIKINYDSAQNHTLLSENKKRIAEPVISERNKIPEIKTQSKLKVNRDHEISNIKDKAPVNVILASAMGNAEIAKQTTTPAPPQQENIITDKQSIPDTITRKDVLSTFVKPDSGTNNTIIKEDNAIAQATIKPNTPKNKYPWQLGVSFAAGLSRLTKGFIFTGRQQSLDAIQYSPGSSAVIPRDTATAKKASMAFIAGISADKNISQKTIFSSGLNYKLFTVTNIVGNDSAGFFSASNINTYRNHFHYIELPVSLKFQIVTSPKIKLLLSSGVSISRLISTNALQFNNSTGLYYRDNSLFNKTQIGLNAGLDMALPSKEKGSFLIGPYINYGISKIAKEGYYKYHFMFTGLRAQYFFRKK